MKSSHRTKRDFERAVKKIGMVQAKLKSKLPVGLRIIAEEVMMDIKASRPGKGVPVDTGALRSTGRVEGPAAGVVTLSFGGPAAPYALVQHETIGLKHRVGEARYLVRGIERWRPGGVSAQRAVAELNKAIAELGI